MYRVSQKRLLILLCRKCKTSLLLFQTVTGITAAMLWVTTRVVARVVQPQMEPAAQTKSSGLASVQF